MGALNYTCFIYFSYANGNILEGEFKLGKIHGHAVFRYPDGDQREGFFRDNVLDGQVIFTQKSGKTSIEVWRNGKRVTEETKEVASGGDTAGEAVTAGPAAVAAGGLVTAKSEYELIYIP